MSKTESSLSVINTANIFSVVYEIKIFLLIMISRIIRGARMGFGVSGIAFAIWFFLFSAAEYQYLWGGFAIAIFFTDYLMYRFAYSYVYDEWNDHH